MHMTVPIDGEIDATGRGLFVRPAIAGQITPSGRRGRFMRQT